MPNLFEIGLEPVDDDLIEFKGLEPLNETSFDPVKDAVSNPVDTYHRVMGGLTTGALGSVEGVARWGKLITDAQNAVLDRVGLGAPSAAVSKGLGKVADVFGELKQDVQTYSESKRNRERDPLFSAQLAEAGGNFAGQIATAAVGKVPAIISNVGQMFQQEYGAAKEKGADDLTAYQAGVYNLPAAFLDYFTESKMVKSLIPEQAKRTIAEVTKKIFTNAGLEGATEVIQDEYSNWLAGNALKYDQERAVENRFSKDNLPETGKQIAKTFAIGGILGGTATTAFEALQPAKVDEKGLAKEVRLEALQKELDQINETQEKTQTSTTELTSTVPTTLSTATGDPAFASLPEVSRVRANVDPVFAEHVKTVRTLPEEERPSYLEKFNLTSDEVGLSETAQDAVTQTIKLPPNVEEVVKSAKERAAKGDIEDAIRVLKNYALPGIPYLQEMPSDWDGTPEEFKAKKERAEAQIGEVNDIIKGLEAQLNKTAVPEASVIKTQPITQPEAITGIPSESDLKKIDVLKKATDVLKEDWESAPQIEVVADVSGIPDTALTAAEKETLKGNVTPDGLFGKDGKVYIISDKVPNIQRVKELVLHETKAHYGFKSLFGGDDVAYKRAMQTALDEFNARPKMADALAARRGGFKDLADLVKAYDHLNVEHKEGKYAITEELLSRAAELYHDPTKPRPTWFNRIISRIKLALQPIMPGMKLNDQDIINLLGAKSTELLDAAGQKVETGQAEIPKFSLNKSKMSLGKEIFVKLSKKWPEIIYDPIAPKYHPNDSVVFDFKGNRWEAILSDGVIRIEDDSGKNILNFALERDSFSSPSDEWIQGDDIDRQGQVPYDIWEELPKEWWKSDIDESNPEEWEKFYEVQVYDSDSGYLNSDAEKFLSLKDAVDAYVKISQNEKRIQFFNGSKIRDKGEIIKYNETVIRPNFTEILLKEFPGMDKYTAQSISRTRNKDNPDPYMVAQAWARHNLTNYDQRINEISENTLASDSEKTQARKEIRDELDKILEEWRKPNKASFSLSKKPNVNREKKPAPAVYYKDQTFEGDPNIADFSFPYFNLTEDIPGHVKNSTVSADTLIDLGYGPPEGYTGKFEKTVWPMFSLTGNQEVDTILKDLNTTAAKLETKLFDDFNAIARVEKKLNLGKRLDASMSGWTAALQTRNLANVMKSVFTNGMIQYNPNSGMFETNQNSPAMRDIFNPLTSKGLLPTWENYAKALRAQTLVEQKLGKKWANVTDQEVENLTGFTKTDADKWIGEGVGHKEVTDAQDAYQKHNQAIRDFALETGLISEKQKDAMDQLLNYVPFFRQMDKEGNLVTSGRSGLARQKSGIKEFKGSKREILPLLESITAQTSRIIDAGMKNIAAQRAVGVMQAAGVAERLPTQTNPFTADVASVIKDVEDLGVDFSKLPKESQQSLAALLSTTTASQAKSTDPNVVTIRVNGKPQHYETKDPALAQALQSLSKPEESFLIKVIRGGKTLQTVTATMAPAFAMRNFMRDTLSTFVQSGDLGHPLRAFKGLVKALGNSQELRSIQAAGSGGSAYYNIDPKSINQVLKQDDFWKNRWNDKAWLGTLTNAYKNILHAAENANRIAVYDKFIKKGATQAEAAFQAQDTLNFQMRGASKSMQLLANAVPFLNARMQGLYKIGRSYEDDPKGVSLRGGMLLLGTMGLWALNHFDREDEDENGMNWYESLPDADKLLYWNFKLPFTKTIARIPKPFEIGTMFATIPELMLDALNDPKELRRSLRLGGQATAQAVPFFGDAVAGFLDKGDLSQAILQSLVGNPLFKIPVELAANKNLFFNRPIVPESKKRLPKELQYNESTSATAKAAGNILGVSPMKADYLMNAILSSLTPYVTFVTDAIAKSAGVEGAPNKRTVDYLGAGWVSRNAETMGNRYIQDFYQLKQDVDETYFAVRQMFLEQKHDEATAFLKSNEKKIAMRGILDATQKQLKAYTNQLIAIRGDEDLSDEQRKKKEDEIFKQRNSLLSRTLKQFNK